MKIKNLLLVALMAICSMNAFAQNPYKANGIVYYLDEGLLTAVVQGVQPETLTDSKKDLEIPKTVTYDGKTYKVTGFRNWADPYEYTPGYTTDHVRWFNSTSDVPTYEMEDIQGKIEKLTVNIDNFIFLEKEDFRITSLKEVVFKGKHTGDLNVPEIETNNVTFEVFDMSGVEVESGVLTYNGSPSAGSGDYAGSLKVIKFPKDISVAANAFKDNVVVEEVEAGDIFANAFNGATSLKSIKVLGTEIGDDAFNGCSALATAEMNEVTSVGENAFVGTIITAANLPKATTIHDKAFKGVTTLTSASFPKATKIDEEAFRGCTGITALELPATLTTIGADAFKGMTGLTTLTANCEAIGGAYFADDAALATLTLTGVKTIAENAFKGLTGVTTVTIPAATSIGASAFEGCTGVTAVTLPATLTSVGANVFKGTGITELTLPAALVTIAENAFAGMTALTTVNANCATIGNKYFAGDTSLTTLNLAEVTSICEEAFMGLASVTTATFPKATTIGANAFKGTSITALTLPACLLTIADDAFANMASLETVTALCPTVGKYFTGDEKLATLNLTGVTEIEAQAFKGLGSVTAVTFATGDPAPAVKINSEAFYGTGIAKLNLPANIEFAVGATDVFANMKKLKTLNAKCATIGAYFTGDEKLATLNLTGVTEIEAQAFKDLASVTAVTFNTEDPVEIGTKAFYGTSIAELTIPENVTFVAGAADVFANNAALTTLTIECPEIGKFFDGDTEVTSLTLANVDAINGAAFKDMAKLNAIDVRKCPNLTSINPAFDFSATGNKFTKIKLAGSKVKVNTLNLQNSACKASLKSISLSAEDTQIPANTFKDFTKLISVELPATIEDILDNAFEGTTALESITLPEGLDYIGESAFDGSALTAISLPDGVYVDEYAFANCEALATVTLEGDLSGLEEGAFQNCAALTEIDLSGATTLTALKAYTFDGCEALATITLPETIEDMHYACLGGTAIETLDASMVDGNVVNIFKTDVADNITLKVLKLGDATISGYAFENCLRLKTAIIGADDILHAATTINSYAFQNCDRMTTVTVAAPADIKKNAFDRCSALTTFNYQPEAVEDLGTIDGKAFTYCTPYVVFNTTKDFIIANPNAPLNTAYGADAVETTIKTVQDKANANQFVAKFSSNTYNVIFNADDVKLFTVYVDGENAYFQACRTYGGKYFVAAREHVILKTTEAKDVNYVIDSYAGNPWEDPDYQGKCVGFDDVKCLYEDGVLGDIQTILNMGAKDYLYRLTNTTGMGFGFTEYSGTTIKANQFFVKCTKAPAAGRLNTVWLDEDGNVIDGEATAIKAVKNIDANDGAIYNLQGVRVDNPVKGGLYIQNGKKIVVK